VVAPERPQGPPLRRDFFTASCLWEFTRTALEVEAVRVPEWKFDKDRALLIPNITQNVPEPPFPARPIRATEPKEKIRLVPYGCTILRMTQLPVVDSGTY
jgi:hypothetical protein